MVHAVRAKQQGSAVGEIALHPGDALFLKRFVTDREDLVGNENIRREGGRNGESKPHDHPRRIVLDGIVDVRSNVGEGDDFLALGRDFGRREAEQRGSEIDIGESRVLRVKSGAELEQRADAATHFDAAARRRNDAGDDLEQGRFAGAVLADDSQRFARGQLKRDIVERTKGVRDSTSTQQIDYQPNTRHVVIGFGVILADRGKIQ